MSCSAYDRQDFLIRRRNGGSPGWRAALVDPHFSAVRCNALLEPGVLALEDAHCEPVKVRVVRAVKISEVILNSEPRLPAERVGKRDCLHLSFGRQHLRTRASR